MQPTHLQSECNMDCNCVRDAYSPICGIDNVVYFSPCHAGCTASWGSGASKVGIRYLFNIACFTPIFAMDCRYTRTVRALLWNKRCMWLMARKCRWWHRTRNVRHRVKICTDLSQCSSLHSHLHSWTLYQLFQGRWGKLVKTITSTTISEITFFLLLPSMWT